MQGLPPGAGARLVRDVLDPSWVEALLAHLVGRGDWHHEQYRHIRARRATAWAAAPGVTYRYSGQTLTGAGMEPVLAEIVAEFEERFGTPTNSVLLNRYPDGRAAMGWHADDEPELGPRPAVLSLSLGAARDFQFKPKEGGSITTVRLEHNSLLLMEPGTQERCLHRLPPRPRVEEERYNLTLRRIRTPR